MAAYGLGEALCHAVGAGAVLKRVAFIQHDRQDLGEVSYGRLIPHQRRAASFTYGVMVKDDYAGATGILSLQPVATAHMTVSIVWEIDNLAESGKAADFLEHCRFAGGRVIEHGKVQCCADAEEAFALLQTGFVLLDRRDIMQREMEKGANQAEVFVAALGGETLDSRNAWLSATSVGYASISPLADRPGARDGHAHMFVEPMLGLVEYYPLWQWHCTHEKSASSFFWQPRWQDDDVFYLYQ